MTEARSIYDLRTPWGAPRFYLPGQHPATARMRAQLAMAEDLALRYARVPANLREFISYLDQKLHEFERGEDRAKIEAAARLGLIDYDLARDLIYSRGLVP